MKTAVNYSAVIALALIIASCATPYQNTGFRGGYSDTALAPDVYRVSFQGNGFTSSDRAQDLALLHAADVTLSHGFRYFGIVNQASSSTLFSITESGDFIYKPKSGLLIQCFADRPERGYVFDAHFLSNSIRTKYNIKT